MSEKSVKDYLMLEQLDHSEVTNSLLTYFKRASLLDDGYFFESKDTGSTLHIKTDTSGKIIEIVSAHLTDEDKTAIEKRLIQNLIEKQERKIGRFIAFSKTPVAGYFRYKDWFQVMPAPAHAPKPDVMYADHPFVIEVSYIACPDMMLDYQRRYNVVNKYIRILDVLLNSFLTLGHRYATHEWIWNEEKKKSEWKQVMYSFEGFDAKKDDFSDHAELPIIEETNPEKYYAQRGIDCGKGLIVPSDIKQSLDLTFALSEDDFGAFYNACTWVHQARQLWEISHSSSFIAHVSALEALIDKPKDGKRCEEL